MVGESEKAVDKALNMIKVKYTILEPVLDFRKSLDNKVLVHPEDDWSSSINTGDVKRNLIHHDAVISATRFYPQTGSYANRSPAAGKPI